ncbi:MAG: hypothetical protein PHF61_06215, partial [Bacteroidales bacterium]|nr:hypothetical protein [Bacteroidales bacterium]
VPHTKFSKINEMHEKGDRGGGMELGRVWIDEKKNRESSRIAFFLHRRALLRLMRANRRFACRLKQALPVWASPAQESHAVWKNAGEKPVRKLSVCSPFRFAHLRAGFSGVLIL